MKTTLMNYRAILFSMAVIIGLCVAPVTHAAIDTVTNTADSGPGSLRDTIAAANSGDTIVFSLGLGRQTIFLTSGELLVTNSITIDASDQSYGIVINCVLSRGLEIDSSKVTMVGLTVTNGGAYGGFPDGTGGAILVDSGCAFYATNCVFSGNYADLDGGGIECDNAAITLSHCTVSDCSANGAGGGIDYVEGSAALSDCSISNNSAVDGGGIHCYEGTLTLSNCIVSGNFANDAGGINCGPATFTLDNCTVSGNSAADTGGGVDADGLAATNCIFFGNSANEGGALNCSAGSLDHCVLSTNWAANGAGIVENNGELTLNDCTVAANTATNLGSGGGILNGSILTANNCTFSGNVALNGAAIVNSFAATLNDCTLSGNLATNGAGIYNYETLVMNNCTVSSNAAIQGDGGGIYSPYDGIATIVLTNTIVSGNTANFAPDISGYYSGAANFIGGSPPNLAPLGDYGGPTQTMPPLPGSPIIDAGVDSVTNFLATDQRGYPRLFGAHVDIGAVEARNFVVLNANDDGNGSLRWALTNSPDYVTFTNTLAGQTIYLTSGELLASNTMTIDASALPGGIIIDAGKNSRVMEISNATVTLNSLTLTNGYISGNGMGGAVLVDNDCALIASNCVVSGNFGSSGGGGIENKGAITLSHCTVSDNVAPNGTGGGIDYEMGTAALNDCTFSGNSSEFGGGIQCFDGTLVLSNCVFSGNSAISGGGMEIGSAATLNQCTFSGNSAANIGGGIDAEGTTLAATNCSFSHNLAKECGAVECTGGTLRNCTFSGNAATNAVGAVENDGPLTLYSCTFATNTALNGDVGGITSGGILTATDCTFTDNTGTNAGAIANSFNMTLNDCTLSGNSATSGNGGGIYNYWYLSVSNCYFSLNTATQGQGGGIFNWHTLTLNDCTLYANIAANGGGIAGRFGGGGATLTANNCTFFGNGATNGGGIFNAVSMTVNNCTFFYNSTAVSGFGGAICGESADAIYGYYPTNCLINCTIDGNYAFGGDGGGFYNDSSSIMMLTNTIVAGNTALNGADVDGTYTGLANFVGGNPQLATIGNYGGLTQTMPPEFGSPVIDAGTDWVTNFLATDQRGFPRLAGTHVDIGAVEAQTAPANNRPVLGNLFWSPGRGLPGGVLIPSSFRFYFTSVPNADFTVIATTNLALPLAQWTVLGNAQRELEPGYYQFQDNVPTGFGVGTNNSVTVLVPQRFYRVVSP